MAGEIEIKKGEGKWISFSITRNSVAVDVSSASGENDLLFGIKADAADVAYLLAKSGESFDKDRASSGELRVNVTAIETTALGIGSFESELKIVLTPDEDVDKSAKIPFIVKESVLHT